MAGRLKVRAGLLPGGAHFVRLDGPGADVQPVGLRDVPRISAQVVVQQQLRLAVGAGARAGDGGGVGAEFVLLDADRSAGARRRELARDGAVGPARADQVPRAQAPDRPQAVRVARDVLNGDAEVQVGARPPQQEIVQLEPADEPAMARDRPAFTAVADVAGAPLPQPARIFARGQRQGVPDGRRDPAAAQLDPRKLRPVDDRHAGAPLHQKACTGAARRPPADDDHIVNHGPVTCSVRRKSQRASR